MADFGQPVAAGVNGPQSGIQTLSSLMGLKQQQLSIAQQQIGLQQQQQELQSQTAAATVAQMNAQQYQAASKVNWASYVKPDGSFDAQGATSKMLEVAPNHPEWAERMVQTATAGAQARQSLFNLSQDYQQPIRAAFGTWAADPKAQPSDLAQQLQAIAEDAPKSEQSEISNLIRNTFSVMTGPDVFTGQPKSLEQQKKAALAYARQGLSASETAGPGGLATPVPGTISTGTQVIPTTTNRVTGVTSPAQAPPVANLHNQITLANGQIAILNAATGRYELVGSSGGSAGPGGVSPASGPAITAANDPNRPSPNAPMQLQAQWQKSIAETQSLVASARHEDTQAYGNNMAIAQDIRTLSETAGGKKIGPGTPEFTRLVGSITSRFGGSQGVTDVQTLESFLDRQAASMTSAMGLPATNLGNEQARTISGNIGMQVGALRAKNDYNEALAQGLHDYRSGLDQIAGFGGNASPTLVNQYRAQWAKYFNPTAIEYNLAKSRGDRQLQDAIAKSVTSGQAKRMLADLDAMKELATTGKLP